MAEWKLISADSHIVEPPDMYTSRIAPKFRDRAPRMERRKTPAGRDYDAWMLDGQQVGTLGAVMQAGQRFEDPSQIDFLGVWEDVRKGAYNADAMIRENEEDGIWGSVLQPSQGLFWYRVPDSDLLSEICRCYNDWIADFCKANPTRLKGIAMLNVDDPDAGAKELERVVKMGLVGSFIPVSPQPDKPYSSPIYDRFWAAAQELEHPLLLHIGTPRDGIPANEFTMDITELTGAGRSTTDYWKRNMFVEFMEDDLGVQLRDRIGVENMLWGSDYPHAEATFPRSQQFLQRMFTGVPEADLRKITSENAAKMFGFSLN